MMRKAVILWMALGGLCAAVLFHTSQEVSDGRSALRSIEREIQREEESIRVLQAEWSYLNQPERLEKLARQYLTLTPLQARQFTRISDLNENMADLAPAPAPAPAPAAMPVATRQPAPASALPQKKPTPPPTPARAAPFAAPVIAAPPPPPAPAAAAAPKAAPSAPDQRRFDDVMKSLGVN